jgi:cell shape-determining protein MreC
MSDYDKLDRIMELHSKIEDLQKENARLKELLWKVVSSDDSRYNRPAYYFEIKKELEK